MQKILFAVLLLTIGCERSIQKVEPKKQENINQLQIDSLISVADTKRNEFDYEASLKIYVEAIDHSQIEKDTSSLFKLHLKTGELFRSIGKFTDFKLEMAKAKGLLHSKKISERQRMSFYNRNAALFAEVENNPDSVLYYSEKALKIANTLKDSNTIFTSKMQIAQVVSRINANTTAYNSFNECYLFAIEMNEPQLQCDALANMYYFYNPTTSPKSSLEIIKTGYTIAKNNDLKFSCFLFSDFLYNYYKKDKNYTEALKYKEESSEYLSVYTKKIFDERTIEIEKKYKLSEKEKSIQISNFELKIAKNNLDNEKIIRNASLFLLFFSIVVLVILWLYYRKIQKQNKTLSFLHEQNTFLISETNHRVNNNLQLISIFITDQLSKAENKDNETLQMLLSRVESIAVLHRHLYQEKDMKLVEINTYISDVLSNLKPLMIEKKVDLDYFSDDKTISADKGMYFGLLITELCTNSLKHAFKKGDANKISIKIKVVGKGFTLNIRTMERG